MGDESTLYTNLYNFAWSVLAKKLWEYESEINVSKKDSVVTFVNNTNLLGSITFLSYKPRVYVLVAPSFSFPIVS